MKRIFIAITVLVVSSCSITQKQQSIVKSESMKPEIVDGVPFFCADSMRSQLIKDFTAENKDDKETIDIYISYINTVPTYSCRDRKTPNVEYLSWCDGSGCEGATGTMQDGKCIISDKWSGQDDQDIVDPVEQAKDCLVESDFRK